MCSGWVASRISAQDLWTGFRCWNRRHLRYCEIGCKYFIWQGQMAGWLPVCIKDDISCWTKSSQWKPIRKLVPCKYFSIYSKSFVTLSMFHG